MRVVVPFAARQPKTRLEGVLSAAERAAFARTMLEDVLNALDTAGHEPEVLATAPVEVSVPVQINDRPLTTAINAVFAERIGRGATEAPRAPETQPSGSTPTAVAVVMADLALATPEALSRLFDADGDVVLAPGRGGGTNALISRHPEFRVDYHGASYRDHVANARALGASVTTIDSFRLAIDIDERADLADLLLHGEGRAIQWLCEAGFELAIADGRVGVRR